MKYEKGVYSASDYAGFVTKDYSFYYGYEQTMEVKGKETWAFTAANKEGDIIFRWAVDQNAIDFDCTKGLLVGIAYFIDQYLPTRDSVNKENV